MLVAIAISLLYVEIKNSVLKSLFTEILKKFWSEWELRTMVVVSLILQFLLAYVGRKRKRYTGKYLPGIAISAWLLYLSADWMATLVLSTLLKGSTELENGLIVFWTPFLLWHLGSPHNITAYSLEDNELWLRHFLGMVFQIGEAIYVYVRFRSNTELNALAIPLFIGGVIKYVERTWALRCASPKQLVKFFYSGSTSKNPNENSVTSEANFLRETHSSFDIFKPLFLNLPFQISPKFHDEMVYLESKTAEEAFNFVGIELGFLYDLLYTKKRIQHEQYYLSIILRSICCFSLVSVLIAFSALLHKIEHAPVDTAVTYLLLSGALCLEIYSVRLHFRSKWTMLRYAIPRDKSHKLLHQFVHSRLRAIKSRKGIKKMAQYDLIDYCVKAKAWRFTPITKFIDTANLLQRFWHSKWEPVDTDLKKFIYDHLEEKRSKYKDEGFKLKCLENLLAENGDNIIKEKGFSPEDEDWKMESTDFIRRIFVWHIATSLVYYDDLHQHRRGASDSILRIGKSLSDYMMYLVLVRPSMLPNGFSDKVNKDTYVQFQRFSDKVNKDTYVQFQRFSPTEDLKMPMKEIIAGLLQLPKDSFKSSEFGALFEGVKFAQQLQSLVRDDSIRWDVEDKWRMISEIWMEMMVYAASRCTWKEHAQQLTQGGELLTHVSLLMAHLGLSTQVHRLEISPDDQSGELPVPDF